MATDKTLDAPIHPGKILRVDFLEELGLTPYRVAKACGVPRTRIERLCREEAPVTADTALRLEKCFGASARFWMNLQARYDLETTEAKLADALDQVEQLQKPAKIEGPVKSDLAKSIERTKARTRNARTDIKKGARTRSKKERMRI